MGHEDFLPPKSLGHRDEIPLLSAPSKCQVAPAMGALIKAFEAASGPAIFAKYPCLIESLKKQALSRKSLAATGLSFLALFGLSLGQ